jgi:hypothetical protein
MSPWLTLFGPTLAAGLVYIGWTRTHKDASERDRINQDRASDREFKNWQRSTIAQTISPALEEMALVRRDYDNEDIPTVELTERLKRLLAARGTIQITGYVPLANEYHNIITTMIDDITFYRHSMRQNDFVMMTERIPGFQNDLMAKTLDVVSDQKIRVVFATDNATASEDATKEGPTTQ